MKNIFYILMSLIFICELSHFSSAQSKDENFSRMNFSIKTPKNAFLMSEPFSVISKIENYTGVATKRPVYCNFSAGKIHFFAENIDKKVFEITRSKGYSGLSDGNKEARPLLSGSYIETNQIIKNFLENSFFTAGEYRVWAELEDADYSNPKPSRVISNSVMIFVSEPKEINYEAYLKYKELIDLESNLGKGLLDSYCKMMQEFVDKYGDTPYASHIADNLAKYYIAIGEYEKARNAYSKIKSDYLFKDVVDKRIIDVEKQLVKVSETPK